jgi:hypothetical protein
MGDPNQDHGTFIRVNMRDSDHWYHIETADLNVLKRAVSQWLERGIDTLLELNEGALGCEICLPASLVMSFYISTPEMREKAVRDEARADKWDRELRRSEDPEA